MQVQREVPKDIDAYIATFTPEVQAILQRIRSTVRKAAPDARETISYRMPTFVQSGVVIYFAAFKKHIGVYPPVRGDAKLLRAVSKYAGEKGNLSFPLDEPMPYELIAQIVKLKVRQNVEKARAKAPSRK